MTQRKTAKEETVKAHIRRELELHGLWYFMPAMGMFGRAGIPDYVGICEGRFWAIEAKGRGGRLTALQERELQRIAAAGGIAMVVTDKDDAGEAVARMVMYARECRK